MNIEVEINTVVGAVRGSFVPADEFQQVARRAL